MATLVFLLLQVQPQDQMLAMAGLGSAVVVALMTVRVQAFCNGRNLVVRRPASVLPMVDESCFRSVRCDFSSCFSGGGGLGFGLGFDLNEVVSAALAPPVFALNPLPGFWFTRSL